MLSLVEENYLKAIYHLSDGGREQVSTNAIADAINTKPASVSDMIQKLDRKGVIKYTKYQGVKVTGLGIEAALRVIRKHRLWEVFLVEQLNFHWDEVHEVAEQLDSTVDMWYSVKLDGCYIRWWSLADSSLTLLTVGIAIALQTNGEKGMDQINASNTLRMLALEQLSADVPACVKKDTEGTE